MKRTYREATIQAIRWGPVGWARSYVAASGLFDMDFYLRRYPEVQDSGIDPIRHYLRHGARNGHQPCACFDTVWYRNTFPDVARSGMNPLVHYLAYGRRKGRRGHPVRFAAELQLPSPAPTIPAMLHLMAGSPLAISGWCFHKHKKVREVRLIVGDTPFTFAYPRAREDLIGSEPDLPEGALCGFYAEFVLVEPGERRLTFEVVLETEERFLFDFSNQIVVTKAPTGKRPVPPSRPVASLPSAPRTASAKPTVFTLACKDELPAALAVRAALLTRHPGYEFLLVCPDLLYERGEVAEAAKLHHAGVRIAYFPEISSRTPSAALDHLAFRVGARGLSAALLPFVFAHLLALGRSRIVYVHPRLPIRRPLTKLLAALERHDLITSPPTEAPPPARQEGSREARPGSPPAFLALRATPHSTAAIAAWRTKAEHWVGNGGKPRRGARSQRSATAYLPDRAFVFRDAAFQGKVAGPRGPAAPAGQPARGAAGKTALAGMPSYFDFLPGMAIPLPQLFRGAGAAEILAKVPHPYRPDETVVRRLLGYLTADVFGDGTLTRFAYRLWETTPALRRAFRDLQPMAERKRLAALIHQQGARVADLPESLLRPTGPGDELPVRHGLAGINIIGYFANSFGIAQVAKSFVRRVAGAGIPIATFTVHSDMHLAAREEGNVAIAALQCEKPLHDVNLFFVNADQIIDNTHLRFPYLFTDKLNVGVFWWEFEAYFERFRKVFDHVDHVVVFSEFIAGAVRKAAPARIQVSKLPYPYDAPSVPEGSRARTRRRFGLRDNEFVFLFFFDFLSTMERKNPDGLVQAFAKGCGGSKDARLVLKTLHAESNPQGLKRLLGRIRALGIEPNVTLINEGLAQHEMTELLDAADCFASLHRSEGLGLGLLDSMLLGKPVIATRYGGNLEFMDDDNSLLVDFSMTAVRKSEGPYRRGWKWADPDIEHAATLMRKLYDDRRLGRRLGRAGKKSVETRFDPERFKGALLEFCAGLPAAPGTVTAQAKNRS